MVRVELWNLPKQHPGHLEKSDLGEIVGVGCRNLGVGYRSSGESMGTLAHICLVNLVRIRPTLPVAKNECA